MCLTGAYLQVYGNHGPRVETYTERVKGAVVEEQFVYADCYDDSVNFAPPRSHVTKVHVELVCSAGCLLSSAFILTYTFQVNLV